MIHTLRKFPRAIGSALFLGILAVASPAKADFKYDYNVSFPTGSPNYTIGNW